MKASKPPEPSAGECPSGPAAAGGAVPCPAASARCSGPGLRRPGRGAGPRSLKGSLAPPAGGSSPERETPAHLLNDFVTWPPLRAQQRRRPSARSVNWMLEITGEACSARSAFIDEPGALGGGHAASGVECGYGRSEFRPPFPESVDHWCGRLSRWTGVRLADVLKARGVAPNAVYLGYESADTHLSGDPKVFAGRTYRESMEDDCLLPLP